MRFALDHITRVDVEGKSVLEVGSYNVNGSFRDHIRYFGPLSYLGVDAVEGTGVDQVCRVEDLVSTFGPERFDLIVSTEMLEHVADWRKAVRNPRTYSSVDLNSIFLFSMRSQEREGPPGSVPRNAT
jgi:hypothetical protein